MQRRTLVREAGPGDALALRELERLSPEAGRVAMRLDPRVSHFDLASRYPCSKGYVALAEDASTIIGTIFSSVAPTQLNGRPVPAAYLFGLRVHPLYRRRGVASMLITHARERAFAEAGARVAWAAVIEGNQASLQTCQQLGFVRLRDLRAKIILGALRHGPSNLTSRPASLTDLPAIADASNRCHLGHNFWRPKTPGQLRMEMEAAQHSVRDSEIALAEDGTPMAAVGGLDIARVARVRVLGLAALPKAVNHLLAPVYALFPLNALLVRHYFSPSDQPPLVAAVVRAIHRRYLPQSWAAMMVADPLDPVSKGLDLLWGIAGRVHLVVKSDEAVDQSRPSYFA